MNNTNLLSATTIIKNFFSNDELFSPKDNVIILFKLPHCSPCNDVKIFLEDEQTKQFLTDKKIKTYYIDLSIIKEQQYNVFTNLITLLNIRFVPVLIFWKNNNIIKIIKHANEEIKSIDKFKELINLNF